MVDTSFSYEEFAKLGIGKQEGETDEDFKVRATAEVGLKDKAGNVVPAAKLREYYTLMEADCVAVLAQSIQSPLHYYCKQYEELTAVSKEMILLVESFGENFMLTEEETDKNTSGVLFSLVYNDNTNEEETDETDKTVTLDQLPLVPFNSEQQALIYDHCVKKAGMDGHVPVQLNVITDMFPYRHMSGIFKDVASYENSLILDILTAIARSTNASTTLGLVPAYMMPINLGSPKALAWSKSPDAQKWIVESLVTRMTTPNATLMEILPIEFATAEHLVELKNAEDRQSSAILHVGLTPQGGGFEDHLRAIGSAVLRVAEGQAPHVKVNYSDSAGRDLVGLSLESGYGPLAVEFLDLIADEVQGKFSHNMEVEILLGAVLVALSHAYLAGDRVADAEKLVVKVKGKRVPQPDLVKSYAVLQQVLCWMVPVVAAHELEFFTRQMTMLCGSLMASSKVVHEAAERAQAEEREKAQKAAQEEERRKKEEAEKLAEAARQQEALQRAEKEKMEKERLEELLRNKPLGGPNSGPDRGPLSPPSGPSGPASPPPGKPIRLTKASAVKTAPVLDAERRVRGIVDSAGASIVLQSGSDQNYLEARAKERMNLTGTFAKSAAATRQELMAKVMQTTINASSTGSSSSSPSGSLINGVLYLPGISLVATDRLVDLESTYKSTMEKLDQLRLGAEQAMEGIKHVAGVLLSSFIESKERAEEEVLTTAGTSYKDELVEISKDARNLYVKYTELQEELEQKSVPLVEVMKRTIAVKTALPILIQAGWVQEVVTKNQGGADEYTSKFDMAKIAAADNKTSVHAPAGATGDKGAILLPAHVLEEAERTARSLKFSFPAAEDVIPLLLTEGSGIQAVRARPELAAAGLGPDWDAPEEKPEEEMAAIAGRRSVTVEELRKDIELYWNSTEQVTVDEMIAQRELAMQEAAFAQMATNSTSDVGMVAKMAKYKDTGVGRAKAIAREMDEERRGPREAPRRAVAAGSIPTLGGPRDEKRTRRFNY